MVPPGSVWARRYTRLRSAGNRTASVSISRCRSWPSFTFVGGPVRATRLGSDGSTAGYADWVSRAPGRDEGPDGDSGPRWPWLRAEPTEEPPGLRIEPNGQSRPPDRHGGALGLDRLAPNVGPTVPFVGGPFAQQLAADAAIMRRNRGGLASQGKRRAGKSFRPSLARLPPNQRRRSLTLAGIQRSGDQSRPDEFNPLSSLPAVRSDAAGELVTEALVSPQGGRHRRTKSFGRAFRVDGHCWFHGDTGCNSRGGF